MVLQATCRRRARTTWVPIWRHLHCCHSSDAVRCSLAISERRFDQFTMFLSLRRTSGCHCLQMFAALGDALLAPLPLQTQTQLRRLWHSVGNSLRGAQHACGNSLRQIAGSER
jgi:hypothetical protein